MKYAISYDVKGERHTRYYSALNEGTALEMFKETRMHGALMSYAVSNIKVKELLSAQKKA